MVCVWGFLSDVKVCVRLSVCFRGGMRALDESPQEEKDLFPCQTKSLRGKAKVSDSQHHTHKCTV